MPDPPKVRLCVSISRSLPSATRGSTADWIVSAWTTGGNVPDAIIRLQASPAIVTPQFSFGCGSHDGTPSCDLGAMDAKSAQRQLQAQVQVAAASTATSLTLTAIGSAAHLKHDPEASATISLTGSVAPDATTSPLPIGSLPDVSSPSATLTPGGNAAGLFPTLDPSSSSTPSGKKATTRSVADTAALPEGSSVVGAQLVGLGALAVAFILAVTRLTIRRRPSLATGLPAQPPTPDAPAGTPDAQPGTPDAPAGTADAHPEDAQPQTPDKDSNKDSDKDDSAASDASEDPAKEP